MNLCIDQGNTYTKVGLFENQNLINSLVLDASNMQEWEALFEQNIIDNTIVSSVKEVDPNLRELLIQKSSEFLEFTHTTLLPVKNVYGWYNCSRFRYEI
jgi:type III pantothenate kinase